MQLHVARLCLDCEEVHDARVCPRCSSETFALLSRWIPAPERRARPRPAQSEEADAYKQLLASEDDQRSAGRWLKRGALVAAIGVGGWLWGRKAAADRAAGDDPATDARRER
jgi:hypothetical protein